MLGRLAEAARLVEDALERTRPGGLAQPLAWTLVHRSLVATAAGDVDTAAACGEESLALTEGLDERFISAWSALALAAALLPAGEPARAAGTLLRRAGDQELRHIGGGWRALALELLTGCRLMLGDLEGARRSLALAEATAASTGLPMAAAWAARTGAAVALAGGEPRAAAGRARAAAAAADSAGAGVEAARARTLAGRALAAVGDVDGAVAELERAAVALDAAGAFRHRDAAVQELRKLGRHVHRRTRRPAADATGVTSLTERERQIARLVVDRRTNPQIAAELFLSLKTVETHLRNIFRKLGVSSRVDLARVVEAAEGE
jgi:ATP/maltotriose-dependent transcriptional regulator MalT